MEVEKVDYWKGYERISGATKYCSEDPPTLLL